MGGVMPSGVSEPSGAQQSMSYMTDGEAVNPLEGPLGGGGGVSYSTNRGRGGGVFIQY